MNELRATQKLSNLQGALLGDAQDEIRELANLLESAQEDVCSLTCRSYFPPGYVRSDADHSEKCRAITAALKDLGVERSPLPMTKALRGLGVGE